MPRNNGDFSEGATPKTSRDVLENTVGAMGLGSSSVKDPFTGTIHVDLSDPNHPFHQPMFPDWNKKDGNK